MKFFILQFYCFVSGLIFFADAFSKSSDEKSNILSSKFSTLVGDVELKNTSKANLNVAGSLIFNALVIKDLITISGSIKGTNLKCNTLKSSGSTNIDGLEAQDISISGDFVGKNINVINAKFAGKIKITKGYFNSIDIASEDPIFENTKVDGDILMKKQSNCKSQILYLKNTTINGNVIFEKEGVIRLSQKSKIIGNVINATLELEQ